MQQKARKINRKLFRVAEEDLKEILIRGTEKASHILLNEVEVYRRFKWQLMSVAGGSKVMNNNNVRGS